MKDQILEQIKKYKTIIIHRHVSPDPDAMGSQMGLYHILKASFKDKKIYVTGHFPEKFSYFKANSKLREDVFKNALIIVTDTANQARIDDERYRRGVYIIKIDHHPVDDNYGDINWVNSNKASTSEMIYDFYEDHQDELILNEDAKECLLAGIVADTNRFLFPATSYNTFKIASQFKSDGVDFDKVYRNLYKRSYVEMKLYGYILNNLEIDRQVASIIIEDKVFKDHGVDNSTASNLIVELNNIEDFYVWVFISEDAKNKLYRINIRSRGPIINDVAAKYGGGGHIYASGVRIKDRTKILKLIEDLKQRVEEYLDEQ